MIIIITRTVDVSTRDENVNSIANYYRTLSSHARMLMTDARENWELCRRRRVCVILFSRPNGGVEIAARRRRRRRRRDDYNACLPHTVFNAITRTPMPTRRIYSVRICIIIIPVWQLCRTLFNLRQWLIATAATAGSPQTKRRHRDANTRPTFWRTAGAPKIIHSSRSAKQRGRIVYVKQSRAQLHVIIVF